LLTLAQAQLRDQDPNAARRTLEPLLLPNVDPKLRAQAAEDTPGNRPQSSGPIKNL